MKSIPHWLRTWLWSALHSGEIYPSIRAITAKFSRDKELTITYHLDREPQKFDHDSVDGVLTVIFSYTSSVNDISSMIGRCCHLEGGWNNIDTGEDVIYTRREMDLTPEMQAMRLIA